MTASAPFSPEEIESIRRPFRGASLLPGRAYHDEAVWAFERDNWHVLKWNHLRAFLGRDEPTLDALEPYLGLDPMVERSGEQLDLFGR